MEVSIIIPCTRGERVTRTIASIVKQKTKYAYEILVVGRANDLPKFSLSAKVVESSHQLKPGGARNLGAKKAAGKYLLFIDDDCLAGEGWIDKNVSTLEGTDNVGAVGGKIIGYSNKYFSRCTDFTNFWRQQGNSRRAADQLYTASLGVKKEAFIKVGGFNENLIVGEDVDFVRKLAKNGYQSEYIPQIFVLHDHQRSNLKDFVNYMYTNGFRTDRSAAARLVPKRTYFLLVIPLAVAYTVFNLYLNLSSNMGMIIYLPFIFIGYLVYHLGIAVRLLKGVTK